MAHQKLPSASTVPGGHPPRRMASECLRPLTSVSECALAMLVLLAAMVARSCSEVPSGRKGTSLLSRSVMRASFSFSTETS